MTDYPEMFEIQIFYKFSSAFSMLENTKRQAYVCSLIDKDQLALRCQHLCEHHEFQAIKYD